MTQATLDYLRQHRHEEPATLAAALAADVLTAAPIDRKILAAYMLRSGISLRFRKALEDERTPEQVRDALLLVEMIVGSGIDYVGSDLPETGAQMAQVLAGLEAASLLSAAEIAAVVTLGGGYRYTRLTARQVEEALAALDAEDVEAELRSRAAEAYNAVVTEIDAGERDWETLAGVFAETEV